MPQCPHCRSHQVIARNYAKKIGGTLGSATGFAAGVSTTLRGTYIGSRVVAFAGTPSRVLGSMTGAISENAPSEQVTPKVGALDSALPPKLKSYFGNFTSFHFSHSELSLPNTDFISRNWRSFEFCMAPFRHSNIRIDDQR